MDRVARARGLVQVVFFTGLIAIMTLMIVRNPWFGFFTWTGYIYAVRLRLGALRLLGVAFKGVPVSQMNGRILPWTVAGFVLMMATGLALFYAIPVRTWHSLWLARRQC